MGFRASGKINLYLNWKVLLSQRSIKGRKHGRREFADLEHVHVQLKPILVQIHGFLSKGSFWVWVGSIPCRRCVFQSSNSILILPCSFFCLFSETYVFVPILLYRTHELLCYYTFLFINYFFLAITLKITFSICIPYSYI